jgi:predicted small secreted protein
MNRTILCMLALLPLLASCNTIQGIGQDLQAGGKALTGAASEEKNAPPQNSDEQNHPQAPM